ncbi:MAG: hypothetical protein ABSF61_06185 [Anaerolineales bacterium]
MTRWFSSFIKRRLLRATRKMYGAKYLRAALPEPTGLQPAPDRQAGGQGATIQKYIRLARPLPAPGQNGSTFVRNHAQLVWAYDFLPVIDLFFRQIYAFFIIELASPRVVQFGFTSHPTDAWGARQLRQATPFGQAPRFLIRNRDSKDGDDFARVAKASSSEVLKMPYPAPKANWGCERFLDSVRREGLDPLLIVAERHWHRLVQEYVDYFKRARPYQRIGQRIPGRIESQRAGPQQGRIIAFPVLHRLQHDYRRPVRVRNSLIRLRRGFRPPQLSPLVIRHHGEFGESVHMLYNVGT